MNARLRWFCLLACLVSAPSVALADVELQVSTDRVTLSLHENLTLRIAVQSTGTEAADVSLPEFDGFRIVGQQVQRPMQFSFSLGAGASVRSSIIYTFTLQPVQVGKVVIRPIRAELDGQVKTSQPIEITVADSGQPGASDQAPPSQDQAMPPESSMNGQGAESARVDSAAFLRTVVDKSSPYEGEQNTVTIYLYVRERLQAAPNVRREASTDGLWVHDLLSPSRTLAPSRQMVGNAVYTVYVLRRFAAFALRSGEITIGSMEIELDTTSFFDLFSRGRPDRNQTRASVPITLNVKPLPEAGRPSGNVAVGRFQLSTKLDRTQALVGDAITLTATIQGEGNVRTAELALPAHAELDVLQPEVKDLVTAPNDKVSGTREYRWLLVPRAPGRIELPRLTLQTFDPQTERYQALTGEPLSLEVVGQAASASKPIVDAAPQGDQQDGAATEHTWAPIRTQSALKREYRPLVYQPFFPFALAAPMLLWLAIVGSAAVRRWRGVDTLSPSARALRDAEARMRNAAQASESGDATRFHAEASAALLLGLESRLDENLKGLSHHQLRDLLKERGVDAELAKGLLSALERSEFARFGSAAASGAALAAELGEVRALFQRLQSISNKPVEHAA